MSEELYKKFRPKTLDRVVGNAETVAVLKSKIETGTLPHSIMFRGPSGCAKTTLGRIAAEMLGCHPMDFSEINSAQFRGIDTIRDIQSKMNLHPAAGKVRVYLFDEAHKMTNEAQSAALKIMEDTPEHVYFFICTTEPEKIIPTLRGRCMDMPVRPLEQEEMSALLASVCKRAKIEVSAEITQSIIENCNGSPRLALVLLDKVRSLSPEQQLKAVQEKMAEESQSFELCVALMNKAPWKKVAALLKGLKDDAESTRRHVLGFARGTMLNPRNDRKQIYRAYAVVSCFENHFFDSGTAGLAKSAYEAINFPDA